MKTIVKLILPVLAFMLASAAAVSSNDVKIAESKKPVITAFVQNPNPFSCEQVTVNCSTVNSGVACMTSELVPRQAWLKTEDTHACNVDLYKILSRR